MTSRSGTRPTLYLIAGPNGAGKSTLYELIIEPRTDAPFINADIIQREDLQDTSMDAAYSAAKIAAERRDHFLQIGKSFVTETTFSHPSKLELVKTAKKLGFRIATFHVNVRLAELSVARVNYRVTQGGHDVPDEKIMARYERNKELIRSAVLISDSAFIFDNSTNIPFTPCITFKAGNIISIAEKLPLWAIELYKSELKKYSFSQTKN